MRGMGKAVLIAALALWPAALRAQSAPTYEVDAAWPKPLPEGWITGQLGGVCVDALDNVYVVNRGDITEEEKETSKVRAADPEIRCGRQSAGVMGRSAHGAARHSRLCR